MSIQHGTHSLRRVYLFVEGNGVTVGQKVCASREGFCARLNQLDIIRRRNAVVVNKVFWREGKFVSMDKSHCDAYDLMTLTEPGVEVLVEAHYVAVCGHEGVYLPVLVRTRPEVPIVAADIDTRYFGTDWLNPVCSKE